MPSPTSRFSAAAIATGTLLVGIFAAMVIWFRSDLRREIHLKIVERDAAVLYPMALQQVADSEALRSSNSLSPLTALLTSARQKGMLAVAVFDSEGNTVEALPSTQLFVELPTEDFLELETGRTITRYHAQFPLDQYFAGVSSEQRQAPVLEVVLPLPGRTPRSILGFVRYFIDARPLSQELSVIDSRINRQTEVTLAVGAALIAGVVAAAAFVVQRAQRAVAERNDRLARANLELVLSNKVSAVGQITSHLIHGLQGPVAGLRSIVSGRGADPTGKAWSEAAVYTERLQAMIQETVALLGDTNAHVSYELTGHEIASLIGDRNRASAHDKGVIFEINKGFDAAVDSHRASLLCMIANNLVQNAVIATEQGKHVRVALTQRDGGIALIVSDEGCGIPDSIRERLFEPGRTGRAGHSGLGLAISRLLAHQIGADLTLVSTGPAGTAFSVRLPPLPEGGAAIPS